MFTHLNLRAKNLTTHKLELSPHCGVTAIRPAPPALVPQLGWQTRQINTSPGMEEQLEFDWGTSSLRKGTIYQCKLNNIYLNLTKNQYFITKLLVRMKKNCGSRAVWSWGSVRSSMWRRDDSWGHSRGRVREDEWRKLGGGPSLMTLAMRGGDTRKWEWLSVPFRDGALHKSQEASPGSREKGWLGGGDEGWASQGGNNLTLCILATKCFLTLDHMKLHRSRLDGFLVDSSCKTRIK